MLIYAKLGILISLYLGTLRSFGSSIRTEFNAVRNGQNPDGSSASRKPKSSSYQNWEARCGKFNIYMARDHVLDYVVLIVVVSQSAHEPFVIQQLNLFIGPLLVY